MRASLKLPTLGLLMSGITLPLLAQAHPGHDFGMSMSAGLLHPLSGMDHLLAMLAVGLWAAQLGGALRWQVPLSFIACMAGGAALGLAGIALPGVEVLIAASVVALGLLITAKARLPAVLCMMVTGGFALFHGYAHAIESAAMSSQGFIGGMLITTSVLHLIGVLIAQSLLKHSHVASLRWSGAVIAACGMVMMAA